MTLNCTQQRNPLTGFLCTLISTAALLVSVNSQLKAQVPTLQVYAGAGGTNDYYAGDNNDALTAKFSSIKGVAVDAAGNVYVSDFQNNCIRKITTDGKVSVIAGIPKTGFTVTNNVWPSGPATSTAIPAPGAGIAVADNGTIYFIGNSWTYGKIVNGNLSYFTPASMNTGSLAGSYTFKLRGNYMYRAMGNTVNVINLSTEKEEKRYTVTGGDEIRAMAMDPNGLLYTLSRNGQFSRINTTTDVVTSLVAATPNGNYDLWILSADLAADASGNVYMVKGEGNIVRINAGTYSRQAYVNGPGGSALIGIALASNGDFFVTDQSLFKVYRVRVLHNNNLLSNLTTSSGTLSPVFLRTTSSYTVAVPNSVDKISITPTVEQENATVQTRLSTGTYVSVTSGEASPEYNLNVGNNTIQVLVTAQNGSTRSYSITVTRQGVPPPVPTNLVTTPGRNSIIVSWDAAPSTRYKLFRGTSPDNLTLMSGMPIVSSSFTDNGAVVGTTYYYAVVAMEPTGAESPQGTATPGRANTPPVVTGLQITGMMKVGQTLTVAYDYADEEDHDDVSPVQWMRSNTSAGAGKVIILGATAKSYTLTEDDLGKFISVRVRPYDGITQLNIMEVMGAMAIDISLPVKLTAFTWKQLNSSIQLNWQTATEINSKYFAIERSHDGRKWATIGSVDAAGDSYSIIRYSYTDKNPAAGRNFYRLKMVDRDGYTEFSDIIRIGAGNSGQQDISLYPVPAHNFINVEAGSQSMDTDFTISDSEGKQVKRGRLVKALQQINISELKMGVYYFKTTNSKAVRFLKK